MTICQGCGHEDAQGFRYCPLCGTRAAGSADPADSLLGQTLNGKYRIETEIGAGAMGTVYLGEHLGLKKKVALKVLHPDMQVTDEGLQRFQREGIAAGKFNHPNAIQIFDFDRGEGRTVYLAMEFVEGSNLKVFMRRNGPLEPSVALRLIRQLLSVLAEAHRNKIVHRDLKPDNIMVTTGSRGELRIKVLDFGLSKLVDRAPDSGLRTEVGRIMGTPLYMSPEQCAGEEADERSDLYAVGLILFEMLAGIRPFNEESTTELLITRATREPPSLHRTHPDIDIPAELDRILVKALARRREERFQNAEEMLAALDGVPLSGASVATTTSATRTQLLIGSQGAAASTSAATPAVSSTPSGSAPAAATAAAGGSATDASAAPARPRSTRRLWIAAGTAGALALLLGVWALVGGGAARAGPVPTLASRIPPAERDATQSRYVSLLETARSALRTGEIDGATTAVAEAIGLPCRDAESFLVRAAVYRAKSDFDPALADLHEARRLDPSYLEPILAQGWLELDGGRLDEAERAFDDGRRLAPDDGEVLAGLGAVARLRGRPEARGLLEGALRASPESAQAALHLGRLRLDEGDLEGAVEALVTAKRNDSRSWRAHAWLGEAYLRQDKLDLAESQLREALTRPGAAVEVRIGLAGLLLDRGRTAAALDLIEESLRVHPESGRLQVLAGVAYRAGGRLDDAIEALERGVRRVPGDLDARCLLGVLLHGAGRLDDARAQYEAALAIDADSVVACLDLGLALFGLERFDEAAERFEQVLRLDEENTTAHLNLGLLYMDYLGDRGRAAEHFERYRELGGDDARVAGWMRSLQN